MVVVAAAALVALPGCGSNAVIQYNAVANQVLTNVNAKEGELKKYWTLPLDQQDGADQALASFRKSLAASQQVLDSTDSPDPARQLDDLLGRAVDGGRALADLDTQFADYLTSVAPVAKGITEIGAILQGLDKSRDIPTSIAGLVQKASNLDVLARSIQPPATFQDVHNQLQSFLGIVINNLNQAQKKLAEVQSSLSSSQDNTDTSPEAQTAADLQSQRETKRQIDAIDPFTTPILEGWADANSEINSLLAEARQSTGLQAQAAAVEDYIGQAVQQIQELEKKYK